MQYRDSARLDQSRTRQGGSGGGSRGGRGMALGGGIGGVIMLVLVLLFGGNIGDVLGGIGTVPATQDQGTTQLELDCQTGADIETNRECRWVAYENAVQDYWSGVVKGYQYGSMVLYSGSVATACGTGTSDMGPFYCPGDQTVYVDTSYTGQLLNQLGAQGGDAAELYIIGHEFGHHISNLTGVMEQVQRQGQTSGPDSPAVRLELQADCYAGIWANRADQAKNWLDPGDIESAINAAQQIGDDTLQRRSQGRVVPDSFTHGSSAQRVRWFTQGYKAGNVGACDTFSARSL